MTRMLPGVSPVINTLEVWTRFGIDPTELGTRVALGHLIELPISSGELVYPEATFDLTGQPPFGLSDVLTARDPLHVDAVATAVWMNTPHDTLGGRSPYAVLEDGDPMAARWLALVTANEGAA